MEFTPDSVKPPGKLTKIEGIYDIQKMSQTVS